MRPDNQGVTVVSILGGNYSIKAPAGQEQALIASTRLLNSTLDATKKKYPALVGDKLLVLAALNLCLEQVELRNRHQQEIQQLEQRVSATVDTLAGAMRGTAEPQ